MSTATTTTTTTILDGFRRPFTDAGRATLRVHHPLQDANANDSDSSIDTWFRARLPFVCVVDAFVDDDVCAALVERIDAGAAPAPVSLAGGEAMRPDIRNNERVMFDDVDVAAAFFARVAPFVPELLYGAPRTTHRADDPRRWRAVGVNERFRGYRYRPGQRFAPHFDGCFERNDDERSAITVLLYLNEGCTGGETRLLDHGVVITPKRGTLFLFDHYMLHEGAEVRGGEKHVLRTDVMYRRER